MFDIGFSEIALIAVVGLLVLGPERLPKVARTTGALVRRARSSWLNVRTEIEREFAAEDLKKTMSETRKAADLRADLSAASTDIQNSLQGSAAPPRTASTDERS